MEERKIVALITVDEDMAFEKFMDGPVPYLEHEFGWLEESGIALKNCFITDEDEDDEWQKYLNYLADWIFAHYGDEYRGMSPAVFDEWSKNDRGQI